MKMGEEKILKFIQTLAVTRAVKLTVWPNIGVLCEIPEISVMRVDAAGDVHVANKNDSASQFMVVCGGSPTKATFNLWIQDSKP
jgi:hypothetical protein